MDRNEETIPRSEPKLRYADPPLGEEHELFFSLIMEMNIIYCHNIVQEGFHTFFIKNKTDNVIERKYLRILLLLQGIRADQSI